MKTESYDIENCNVISGCKIIYSKAFGSSLTSIEIPNSVTSITYSAFNYCSSLEIVYYVGTIEQWNTIDIGYLNSRLTSSTKYFYSETEPTIDGNYWHYVDDIPTKW